MGCGDGALTEQVRSCQGVVCYGIDCGAWRPGGGWGFVHGLAEALPFPHQSFDVVALAHVLGHVAAVPPVLAECRRVLRRRGRVGVVIPELRAQAEWRSFCDRQGLAFDTEPTVLRYLSEASLRISLERSGFRVTARAEYGRRPPGGGTAELLAMVATR